MGDGRKWPNPRNPAAECARYAHRAVRRHIRSGARGASRSLSARHEADRSRSRLVAGDARQSVERHQSSRTARQATRSRSSARAHPRIDVTDLEYQLGTHYTYETVAYLVRRCPRVRFVWIMGADNLRSFHRWQRWRGIASAGADCSRRPSRDRACTPGQASPVRRWRGLASRNRRRGRCRNERRRRGFTCMVSSRRCPRLRYGRHGPCTTGECEPRYKRCNSVTEGVETVNLACLS